MKTTLSFDIMGVCRLINHATRSTEWGKSYFDEGEARPCLVFVHDQGLYVMSNGTPGLPMGENVVYAEGFDPEKVPFDEWWEGARAIVGGDDFAEYIDIAPMLPIPENAIEFWIGVTPEELTCGWVLGKNPTRAKVGA